MPTISEEEKLRRRESNASVLGTHAMEGMFPDESTLEIFRQYEQGEFTLEQFSEAMNCHAHALLLASGKLESVA
jgi:hypothetical protein